MNFRQNVFSFMTFPLFSVFQSTVRKATGLHTADPHVCHRMSRSLVMMFDDSRYSKLAKIS